MPDDSAGRTIEVAPTTPGGRWREVSRLADAALELPPSERATFLAAACPAGEVRAEVERLLRACEKSAGFLDDGARGLAGALFLDETRAQLDGDRDVLRRLSGALASRYAIDREVGRGGMARVYLAQDLRSHRRVALKLLRPQLAATLAAERFLREIDTVARLTHRSILPVLESGAADGLLYFVMPYIEGETLRERLDREVRLERADAMRIAQDVASALGYAHRHDVLHRDLKPENVLLTADRAFLTDFGIACAINRASAGAAGGGQPPVLTAPGLSLGTPAYMSPEQARGSRSLDGRSDIYALGCVLFEMLAGRPPYTGPSAANVIRQHVSAPVPELDAVRPELDAAISRLVTCALSKSPDGRFATMDDLAGALRALRAPGAPHGLRRVFGRVCDLSRRLMRGWRPPAG